MTSTNSTHRTWTLDDLVNKIVRVGVESPFARGPLTELVRRSRSVDEAFALVEFEINARQIERLQQARET